MIVNKNSIIQNPDLNNIEFDNNSNTNPDYTKKSEYSKEEINNFIDKKYKTNITLFSVKEGQESQAYWYKYNDAEYIIQINPKEEGFKKDQYANKHFCSEKVPIPKVVEIGKFNNTHFFCISIKVGDTTYEDSDETTVVKLLENITEITETISKINISNTTGYGIFDSNTGNAPFKSWKEFLFNIIYYNWSKIKQKNFVDGALIDEIIAIYQTLIPYCSEERKLWHGDFGSNNIIVDNTPKITGVIDWDCAAYGDSLYDIAISYFWRTWLMCMEKTSSYWEKKFCHLPNFHKRIYCYQLRIGLAEIFENGTEDDEESAKWVQNRCREILQSYKSKMVKKLRNY